MKTDDISDTIGLLRGGGGSSGPLQNLGGVGRGDQGWGHYFTTGVSMCRSREAAPSWPERAAWWGCV